MRRGREIVDGAEHAREPEPSLFVFRRELEGPKVSDRRLVRPVDSKVCFREEDPRAPVLVVARNRFEQGFDGLVVLSFAKEGDAGFQTRGGLLLGCRGRWPSAFRGGVRLESVAVLLRLRAD